MLNISGLDDPMLVVYMAECDDIKIKMSGSIHNSLCIKALRNTDKMVP